MEIIAPFLPIIIAVSGAAVIGIVLSVILPEKLNPKGELTSIKNASWED